VNRRKPKNVNLITETAQLISLHPHIPSSAAILDVREGTVLESGRITNRIGKHIGKKYIVVVYE
jgi:hypothetical protein